MLAYGGVDPPYDPNALAQVSVRVVGDIEKFDIFAEGPECPSTEDKRKPVAYQYLSGWLKLRPFPPQGQKLSLPLWLGVHPVSFCT